jgi:hypothetical protein
MLGYQLMLVQGTLTDPSTTVAIDSRPILGGLVPPSAPGPMWGGMAIQAFPQQPGGAGFPLQLAQNVAQICGWTVFTESTALIRSDTAPVPSAYPGMSINLVVPGSGAQLVLQADPNLPAILKDASITTSLSWDFQNQRLVPYSAAAGALPVKNIIRVVDSALVVRIAASEPVWKTGPAVIVQL